MKSLTNTPEIAAAMVRGLMDATERAGVSKRAFLDAAGIGEERIADPFARFSFEEYEALQGLALDMTGDDALGLRLVEQTSGAAFDLLAQLVPHAPTLRDAVGLCAQFGSLLIAGSNVVLDEKIDVARIRYSFRRSSPRIDRFHAEHAVVGFLRLLRTFAGQQAPILRACFEHPSPSHRTEYTRIFGGFERFDQAFTGIEFARGFLDTRHLHQQPRLYSLLHAEAHRTKDSLEHGVGYGERVAQYLMTLLPSQIPKMEGAAAALGTSARSLRRRLAREGLSYRQVVQKRLEEAAVQALRVPGTSVQEAARATGFSDAAAFDRAFKQWTGLTPTEFQRGVRGGRF